MLDRQVGQELRRSAVRYDQAPAGGLLGGEGAVRDADQHVGGARDEVGYRPGQRVQHPGLAAEVAGRAAHADRGQAGPGDLDGRGDRLQSEHDRLEGARLGQLVAGKHGQVGAAGLRLAAPQPAAHPGDAGRMRAGDHPVGGDHRGGCLGVDGQVD